MYVYGLQQTDETISQNNADWHAIFTVSNEVADRHMDEYKREKRLKYIRRYLKERAARGR